MKAWLLTWEGTRYPATSDEHKIAGILSGRLGSSSVKLIADAIYTRCIWTAADLAYFAHRPRDRESQFRATYSQPNRFFYGRDPCIFARLVRDLQVETDEALRIERVNWTDPAYLRIEQAGGMPVEIEPARARELTRPIKPVAAEIYGV